MDTVLGLALTRSRVGWVLVDGHDADGATLEHDEFAVTAGTGVRAVATAEQAAAAVLRTRALTEANGQRLHAIGVTWSDDAAAEAAVLLESLTGAGFDHVLPVSSGHAVEELARGIGPVIGADQPAVCVAEPTSATVAMIDDRGEAQIAVSRGAGDDALVSWLAGTLVADGLMIAGSDVDVATLGGRLEEVLGVPVFPQPGAQLAFARGAALAATPGAEFTGRQPVTASRATRNVRSRPLSYVGAMSMLVGGAVSFVVSLSLAVGLHLAPDHDPARPVRPAAAATPVAPVAEAEPPASPVNRVIQPVGSGQVGAAEPEPDESR